MSEVFRYYQEEANNAIYDELLINNKCIVKMFCGSGKSLLMRRCKTTCEMSTLLILQSSGLFSKKYRKKNFQKIKSTRRFL
jgi:hypothetical protein|tara:strand:+ start:817 stop:1059 length:243 start_codon:yes stop_codon:yes gene_type:complete